MDKSARIYVAGHRGYGLGWRHRVGLREGVRSTYEWYLQEVGG